jgi:phosphate transport system substrate-binding protein
MAGPIYPWYESLTIIASPATYPLAKNVADLFVAPGARVTAELDPSRMRLDWCVGDDRGPPQVLVISRRITPEELRACMRNGSGGVIELKIGYQAIVLARAKLYGTLSLSARDLFKALAWRIPATGQTLMENPNLTWGQVDPALPDDRIYMVGSPPTSTPGRLALDLLLEPGCNTYPWLAALRESDWVHYNQACRGARKDGVYVGPSGDPVDELVGNPTAIGIFSLSQFEATKDKLLPVAIDGVQPTVATIANGTYPISHTVYLYANKHRVVLSRMFGAVVRATMVGTNRWGMDVGGWGFVQLDKAESAVTLSNLDTLKELQF